jgi:serine/threonine protein kinase
MTQKVGSYQIVGTLRPGARPLYKAQAADQRLVALKTIPANGVTPMERERFLREAQICAGLDHPNLLKVHDSGEADGILYQAMDLLEGADLAKVFADGRQFSWEDKLSIMEQVCAGLDYAHKLNLVHRDIKPANIFLETTGNIRLLDFGMVRTSSSNLTQAGSRADSRRDLHSSLGCVFERDRLLSALQRAASLFQTRQRSGPDRQCDRIRNPGAPGPDSGRRARRAGVHH